MKQQCPRNGPFFFRKHWLWYLTLNVTNDLDFGAKKGLYPKEYIQYVINMRVLSLSIQKLWPIQNSFFRQTNGQTYGPKAGCPRGHKKVTRRERERERERGGTGQGVNPFSNGQILDSSKLKEFADDNFKVYENGRVFIQCFQMTCTPGLVRERVNSLPHSPMF